MSTSLVKRTVMGDLRVSIADVEFGTYATGGQAVDLKQLGIDSAVFVWAPPTGGYIIEYDYSTNKLIARTPTNESDGDAAPAAPADEVAASTDLSALTARIMVYGL